MASAETSQERLTDSTTVLREMSHASDKGIPQDLLQKARCNRQVWHRHFAT
jgi:hypothetical protein